MSNRNGDLEFFGVFVTCCRCVKCRQWGVLSTALVSVECWPAAGQPSVGPARPQCGARSSAVQRNNDRVRLRRDGERAAATTRSVLPHKH